MMSFSVFLACEKEEKEHELLPEIAGDITSDDYVVYVDRVYQEIDNFGASDAWVTKYTGKNWPADKKEKIADLLFSTEMDAYGKPKGIGLSLWRMHFGAGSDKHAGPAFGNDPFGMTPCMRDEEGNYDMSLDGVAGGQFWMLKAAKERGVEQFLGFNNSPPYYWTYTGLTNANTNNGQVADYWYELNLKDEYIDDYGKHLAEIVKRTKELHGVDFDYVCPLNEPEWQANGMESCHANNAEIAKVARAVSAAFKEYGLDTKVVVPESGKPQFVYSYEPNIANGLQYVDPYAYGWKAKNFFSQDGEEDSYIGDLDNVAKLLASHSYWSVDTDNELKQVRTQVGDEINKYGIKYWQTEFCILSNDYDLGTATDGTAVGGGGRDTSMKLGLYVARIIHADLVYANASAWHWWLATTPFDYKDGLIYLVGDDCTQDGEVTESKLLWTFGNFSRFIRPGAHRVRIASDEGDTDNLHGMMASAYCNRDGKVVVVMINYSDEKHAVNINVNDGKARTYIPYLTSDKEGDDLCPMPTIADATPFEIPARSVVTFCETDDLSE